MCSEPLTDRWLAWLTNGRDADSAELRRRSLELLLPIRDEILRAANVEQGETVLDVGTGEGLLGIAALEHVGTNGTVIFSDVSPAVIRHVRTTVTELGLADRASFVVADAAELEHVANASVDAIVLRSVLIYLADRGQAAQAFARVLRPGGRLSLFEPLNAISTDPSGMTFFGYDTTAVAAAARAVLAAFVARQPAGDPMANLTTLELVDACEHAGFVAIDAREHISSSPLEPADDAAITALLRGQPNPLAPSVTEAAYEALGDEAPRFLDALTTAAREGRGRRRQAHVFLSARLPS